MIDFVEICIDLFSVEKSLLSLLIVRHSESNDFFACSASFEPTPPRPITKDWFF